MNGKFKIENGEEALKAASLLLTLFDKGLTFLIHFVQRVFWK